MRRASTLSVDYTPGEVPEGPPIYDPFVVRGPAPNPGRDPNQAPPDPVAAPLGPVQTSGSAIASVVFGIVGFVCLYGIGGLLALAFGAAAKAEIARSEGTRTGSGLAITGMILGGLNVLATAGGLALLLLAPWSSSSSSGPVTTPPPVVAPPTWAPPTATSPTPSPTATTGQSSREEGVVEARIGSIDLVDVDDVHSLSAELERQRKIADKDGKKLVVWINHKDCQPCNGVATSLPDAKLQTALEKVRLVRVDAQQYVSELTYLGIPANKFPGFALLGASSRPVDYVNGGEWDEDIPRNIAPVLGNFVRGSYSKRREPWRGVKRDDETPL